MFGTYDVVDLNTFGIMMKRMTPIAKKTHNLAKALEVLFEEDSRNTSSISSSEVIREKKLHKKVYREYNEKNDSTCLIEAVNPYSFLQERKDDCCNTTTVLLCDLCYTNIEGTVVSLQHVCSTQSASRVVSSNCELQHKCRYRMLKETHGRREYSLFEKYNHQASLFDFL